MRPVFLLLLLLLHEEKVIFKANRSIKAPCLLQKSSRVFLIGFQLKISWFSAARVPAYFLTSDFLPLLTFLTTSDFRLLTSDFRQLDRELYLVFHACPTILVRILTGLQLHWFDDYPCELRLVACCFLRVACCVFPGLLPWCPLSVACSCQLMYSPA